MESQIKAIERQIYDKQVKERAIREEILRDSIQTEEEMRKIDAEIAEINRQSLAFKQEKEVAIDEIEAKEDYIRDLYHNVRSQLEKADENVSDDDITPTSLESTDVLLSPESGLHGREYRPQER